MTLAGTRADSQHQPTANRLRRRPWLSLSLLLRASFGVAALLALSLPLLLAAEAADPADPPEPLWRCESGRQLFPNSSWCCPPPLSQSFYSDALTAVRLQPPSSCVLRGSCAMSSHSPCGDALGCCQSDWVCEGGADPDQFVGGRACQYQGYFAPRTAFVVAQSSAATLARDLSAQCLVGLSPCRHNGTCTPDYERAQCACADGVAFAQPNCSFACPVGSRCEAPESLQSAVYTAEECEPGSFCAPPPDPELSSPPAQPCPAGSYCPARSTAPTRCEAGNYCPAANMSAPLPCPSGQYCAAGCEQPFVPFFVCVEAGRAVTSWTASSPSVCCPSGSFSDGPTCYGLEYTTYGWRRWDTTASAVPAVEVSAHCIPSPCNHGTPCTPTLLNHTCSCPRGFVGPLCDFQCPAGSLCANAPADNSTAFDSSLCPTGFYCPLSALIPTPAPLTCPRGSICPMGSAAPADCGVGHYCPDTGMTVPTPCPGGLVCTSLNATAHGALLCSAGQVCEPGQPPALCPVGFYCPMAGMNASLPCPLDHTCPFGSVQPLVAVFACPSGTGPLIRPPGSTTGNPLCCPSGHVLNGTSCISTRCGNDGDVHCGAYSPAPTQCCRNVWNFRKCTSASCVTSTGNYIAPFSSTYGLFPTPVEQWPMAVEVSANCRPNPCGHNGTCTPTFSGFECNCGSDPAFTPLPLCVFACPPGRACSTRPLGDSTAYASAPCPAGWFCSNFDGAIPTQPAECPQGHFCPQGSGQPIPCPPGFMCPDPQMAAPVACTRAGTMCLGYSTAAMDCPAGYFCGPDHNRTVSCPRGHYCPTGSEMPLLCPGGFLGSATRLSNSSCSGICPLGRVCAAGSIQSQRCDWCPAGSAAMAPCPRDHQCDLSKGTLTPCPAGLVSAQGSSDCQKPACPPLQKREGPGDEGGCQLAPGGIALIVCMVLLGVLVVSTLLCLRRRRRLRAAMEQRNKRTQVNVNEVGAAAAAAERAAASGSGGGNGSSGASVVHVSPPGGVDIGLRSPSHAIASAPPQLQMAPLSAANSNSNWNSNRFAPSAPAQAHGRPLVLSFGASVNSGIGGFPSAAPVVSGIGGFPFAAPAAPAAAAAAAAAAPPVLRYHPEPQSQWDGPPNGAGRLVFGMAPPAQSAAQPQPATFARTPCAADMPAFGSSGTEGEPCSATGPPTGSALGHSLGHEHELATPPPYSIAVGSSAPQGAPQGAVADAPPPPVSDSSLRPLFCTHCGSALPPLDQSMLRFCNACGARIVF